MENMIKEGRTRREFLKGAGAVMAGGVVVGVVGNQLACEELPAGVANWWTSGSAPLGHAPEAEAYIVYDKEKCAGCFVCQMACATAHEGVSSLSLGRMQRARTPLGHFPDDVMMQVCRQCVEPVCIEACPSGAFFIDPDNGNTRTVDRQACADYQVSISPNVCQLCVEACPYPPSMAIWNPTYTSHGGVSIKGVAMVCDLCKYAPNFNEEGGVNGKQACIEACPARDIKLVHEVPSQTGNEGYDVNLRTSEWANILKREWPVQWPG